MAEMTDEQKKDFFKRMGYSGSCLHKIKEKESTPKKIKPDLHVDKNELLALHKLFNENNNKKGSEE